MALRAGARKILKKSSLFLLIRTSGRHLWECKSFCGDKRDTSLWTEPKERVCCLHFSTPRPTQQRPSPGPQLLDASCLPENRDRSQCVHTVHCFLECIPENCYQEKKFHQTFAFICESSISEGYNSVRRFNFISNPAMSRDYPNPTGNIISL